MAVLFLSTFLTLLIISMSLFTHAEKQSDVKCHGVYPGTDKMVHGVDITKLDLLPLDGSGIAGLRHSVIKITCNEAKTKLQGTSTTSYKVPDQFETITSTDAGGKSASVEVSRSYNQVKEKLAVSVGLSVGYGAFAFSASTSYKKTQNSMLNTNREVLDVSSKRRSHNIRLYLPGIYENFLSSSFQTAIDSLEGKTFKANRSSFEKFISNYGTHYFQSGSFGGMLRKFMETSSSYSRTKTEQELKVQAEASFNNLIASVSASVGFEIGQSKVDSEFTNKTSENVQYYGGKANLLAKEGISNWQPTVDSNPALLSAQVKPLYDLVTDKAMKHEIKAAIDEYVFRNFLAEMQRKINAAMKYGDPLIRQFSERLNEQKKEKFLNIEKVKALDEEIVYETEIPYWFSHETEFCLKYNLVSQFDIHSYTCNDKHVLDPFFNCANPNQYTEQHNQFMYSDRRSCRMHYGIKTTNAPVWFDENVKICVHFKSDSQNEIQCAGPNTFTNDNYVNSQGSVEWRWKIDVNDKVPLWIKKSEVCFQWGPLGNEERAYFCGNEYSRRLCAKAGAWTPRHRELTRKAFVFGCGLKWSWQLLGSDRRTEIEYEPQNHIYFRKT